MNQQAQPTKTETTHEPAPKHRIWVKLGMAFLAIATLVVGGYLFATQQSERDERKYLTNNNKVVCVSLNGPALQCENLDTGERKQYTMQNVPAEVVSLVPSPDQTKYLAAGYDYTTGVSAQMVLDQNFSVIHTLPSDDKDSIVRYNWHGNNALVKTTDSSTESSTIRTFSVVSLDGKLNENVESPDQYAEFAGSDGDTIYLRYTKYDNTNDMGTSKLVLVSTGVGRTIQEIDLSDFMIDPSGQTVLTGDNFVTYDPATQRFYTNMSSADGTSPTQVLKIGRLEGQKLVTLHQGDQAALESPTPVITTNGFVVNNLTGTEADQPSAYEIIGPEAETTKLTLPVSSQNFLFSLAELPNQNGSAANSENQVTAFAYAPKDTPEVITSFLESRVTEDCSENNFRRVSLISRDGTAQIITSESGCGLGASYYYIFTGNNFNQVFASQEGIDCETRDKLGLSEKLVPDCRKPGEAL